MILNLHFIMCGFRAFVLNVNIPQLGKEFMTECLTLPVGIEDYWKIIRRLCENKPVNFKSTQNYCRREP